MDAFGEIVLRFQDMAYGCAQATLGDFHLAQDAAQDAFVEAYRSLPNLANPKAFPGWFRRIVVGKCSRISRKRKLPETPLEMAGNVADQSLGPEEHAVKMEMKTAVLEAIQSLPEKERLVTTLFYIDGCSQQQVAEFLEIPVTTVKNRLYRARKRLKESMMTMVEQVLVTNRPSNNTTFKETVMKIIQANEKAHLAGLAELFYAGEAKDFRNRREVEDGRVADSHYDWEATRVGVVDGEVAAVWSVYDVAMRIGTARVKVAGHNFCKLLPGFDGQDWLDRTAEACMKDLPGYGYDLAVHQGDFEEISTDLGFSPAWRELHWSACPEDLPVEEFDGKLHAFEELTDLPEIAELYNRDNDQVTGTAVRPTFRKNKHPNTGPSFYWTDEAGKLAGYVFGGFPSGENERLGVEETAGDPETCLRILKKLALECNASEIWFIRLPYQSRMGRYLRSLDRRELLCDNPRGMRLKIQIGALRPKGPGTMRYMARIINLRSLFEKLCDALRLRLKKTCFYAFNGTLTIGYGGEDVTLEMDQGVVSVAAAGTRPSEHALRGKHGIVQLVLGSETPEDILATGDLSITGQAAELAVALFPNQYPQMPNQVL